MSQQKRGFTLYEALLTTALIGTILYLSASMLQGFVRASNFEGKNLSERNALHALVHDMRSDVMEAVKITTPVAGKLIFHKLDQTKQATRLTLPSPIKWELYGVDGSDEFLIEVKYELLDRQLTREIKPFGASQYQSRGIICDDVESFQCLLSPMNFEIEIEIGDHTFTSQTSRRVP